MALMTVSKVLDGTEVHSELTLTLSGRTSSSVTVSYSIVTYLNSGGYSGAGYETYTGVIGMSGTGITTKSQSVTLKPKSEGWSGSTRHTVSGSFTLSLTSSSALTATVTYKTTSSADSTNYGYGTKTLSISAYVPPVPANPSTVTLPSSLNYGDSLTVTFSTVSGATGYKIYYSVNSGAWTYKTSVTSGSYTDSSHGLNPGNTIKVKVTAYSSGGESSGKISSVLTVSGGLYCKVSGAWKNAVPYVKVSGSWKKVKAVYRNVSGSWKVSK